jgi:beta-phosphoglucomutase-like phosphatase (HAD superfamily)
LVIEDSLTGVQAALAAGMRPLAYCPPDDGKVNFLVSTLAAQGVECFYAMHELPALIAKYQG